MGNSEYQQPLLSISYFTFLYSISLFLLDNLLSQYGIIRVIRRWREKHKITDGFGKIEKNIDSNIFFEKNVETNCATRFKSVCSHRYIKKY